MDVTEFEELIDRLGEDLSLWPDDRRLPAEELLARSSTAQALLEEARTLRQALAAPPVRAPAASPTASLPPPRKRKATLPSPAPKARRRGAERLFLSDEICLFHLAPLARRGSAAPSP